ncbi:hypothetical protein GGS23DRAFT_280967 [Durotheca rogersii]|uniref:uncharacterized protein n=1 Tax=Durotheca rogersii TaxID=419775 RepID=UPI00221F978E|nr:uncharacterized protein GGS23DRAFT_280967 [Durotheca rogersii]KAI5866647.1 hypothetical protein GGS23DRAFT_280967 [Durotheca rogersii]
MAQDSLRALVDNIPDWLKRLDDLNGQIEQRQLDLASLSENKSSARSIRNRGSTESLKPRDEGPTILPTDAVDSHPAPLPSRRPNAQPQDGVEPPSSPVSEPKSKSSLQQKNEVVAAAQRRVRATVRRRHKTESMVSVEHGIPKYRSRNMIIVYYDSYVQSFFEELVKFVSQQRNSMRKAKLAAKMVQIKRLAELDMPDDEDDDNNDNESQGDLKAGASNGATGLEAATPKAKPAGPEELMLRFRSTRQMGSRQMASRSGLAGGLGSFQDQADIWEELDRGLEFVQGMCEHGAHQFLREGDCSDEIEKIKKRLSQTKEAADKELARPSTESTSSSSPPAPIRSRSYRPMMMRREAGACGSKTPCPPKKESVDVEDEGVQDMDYIQPAEKATEPAANGPSS